VITTRSRVPLVRLLLLFTAMLVASGCGSQPKSGQTVSPNVSLVREHFQLFNNHDAAGVRALATDDVAWYTIEGGELATNSVGADQLESSLGQYFAALPSVRADLEHIHAAGSYVMARERVSWTNAEGERRSQASYSCYEIRDGKINAVWYFPAE